MPLALEVNIETFSVALQDLAILLSIVSVATGPVWGQQLQKI